MHLWTEQNRNFINLYYICTSLNITQQTTYTHKVTLYTLTRMALPLIMIYV